MTSNPSISLTLRQNFSWTLLGNVVYAICQWAMVTVLAKFGSAETLGQFSLALAITAPVIMFTNLQLRGVQATDVRGEISFGVYFSLRLVTTVLAIAVTICLAFFSSSTFNMVLIILLVGLAKAVDSIQDVFYGLFQQREQMDIIAKALIASGLGGLILFTSALLVTRNLPLAAGTLIVSSTVALISIVIPRAKRALMAQGQRLAPSWSPNQMTELFLTALPLGIVMLLISLNTNIPRYFIAGQEGEAELGIFSALFYLVIAGNTIVSALGQSASPRLAHFFADRDTQRFAALLRSLLVLSLGAGVVAAVCALVMGGPIITLLYTSDYAEFVDVLFVLALYAGVSYAASFAGYGITAARSFRVQIPLFILVSVATLTACWVLIPHFGILGAAYSLVIAATVQLLVSLVLLRRLVKENGQA